MFVVYYSPTSIEVHYVKLHQNQKDILEVIYSSIEVIYRINTMRLQDRMQFASSGFFS